MSFVHLHCHSEYSLLDGLSKIKPLVARAKELGMPALALTDHGVMFGAIEFYRACKAAGIQPIIGMEAYLAERGMSDREPGRDSKPYHLLLLAQNDAGYRNLLRIATAAQLEGFYYRPRIDREYLAAHAEGLICTTGCLSAEIPRALAGGREAEAQRRLDWYYEVFGRENFFVELQDHGIPELREVNRWLTQLGPRYRANFVATNDVHYVRSEDAPLQDVLLCIQTGALVSDANRMRMTGSTYYLKPVEEMAALFGEVPGALSNTLAVAERCAVDLEFKGYHLPVFEVPPGAAPDSYLREQCERGLIKRYGDRASDPALRQRLDYELGVIHAMGFDTYFLIVWDLCRYAQGEGIWYNARGSAAGSLVAYCLGITLVDPIEHGLIFERFLNPGRVSMPDIDLDFRDDLRYKMLEYAARKYGEDRVAQIITFGTLGARAAVRDVGRVLDIPLPEVDRVAKLIPNVPGKPTSITQALEEVPAFKAAVEGADYLMNLVDVAARLEGVARNAGTHAAGVVITDRPIVEYIPLHRPTKGSEDNVIRSITQFEMEILEGLGLLKVDFLGLATLTIMARACDLIHQRHGVRLDIHTIPTDDPRIFELLGRGDVAGVFQVEGAGMRRYLVEMRPTRLDHVIAMVALYRPGPIEFIPNYIRRMHGEEAIEYRHPALESILGETYGVTVYQEQIMRTAMNLSGYTASEADYLRKTVAKKKSEELLKQRDRFVRGAVARGLPGEAADAIFDDWEAFARYGFPKGHAADYAVITCQTAYLKAVYPVEYMTALLSVSRNDTDKVALYIADSRRMKIDVLPPDVNKSDLDFTIEDRGKGDSAIRFGLGAVKNVGEGPVAAIMGARAKGGSFRSIDDFAQRADLRLVGKRALESLVKVGALGAFGKRTALLDALDRIVGASTTHFRAADIGQLSMFGGMGGAVDTIKLPAAPSDVPRREQLNWEKELLGLYVSDHPLSPVMDDLQNTVSHFSGELSEESHEQPVRMVGLVTHIRPYQTKAGKPMGFVSMEDLQGQVELILFTRTWAKFEPWLEVGQIVLVEGRVDAQGGTPKVIVDSMSTELKVTKPLAAPPTHRPGDRPGAGPSTPRRPEPPVLPEAPPGDGMDFEPDPDELWGNEAEPWTPPSEDDVEESSPPPPTLPAAPTPASDPGTVASPDSVRRVIETRPAYGAPAGPPPRSKPNGGPVGPRPPVSRAGPPPPARGEEVVRASSAARSPVVLPPEAAGRTPPKRIVVTLRSTGDKSRDTRRLRRVHGLLTSHAGPDQFAFRIFEAGRWIRLDFPNDSTRWDPVLESQLVELLGSGAVAVEPLQA